MRNMVRDKTKLRIGMMTSYPIEIRAFYRIYFQFIFPSENIHHLSSDSVRIFELDFVEGFSSNYETKRMAYACLIHRLIKFYYQLRS